MYKFSEFINFHSKLLWLVFIYLNFCNTVQLGHVEWTEHTTHQLSKRETSNCAKTQFTCKSHDCIEDSMLCDGVKDCKDGSDETIQECRTFPCPSFSFKCAYGACIDSSRKCDGRADCADNSDESNVQCPTVTLNITNKCKPEEWKCKSGKCISEDSLCDGIKNCDDESDETIQQCENSQCPRFKFRCNYGACIESTAVCNGTQECPDGSDEVNCKSTTPRPQPNKTTTGLPPFSGSGLCEVTLGPDRTVVILDEDDKVINIRPGSKAPKRSQIEITCKSGYAFGTPEKIHKAVCFQKEGWSPPLKPCFKTCPILHPENVELSCHRDGHVVSCDSDLIIGTRVRPRCKPLHTEEKIIYYRELKCQENGEWDENLYKCVPDCGVPSPQITTLIFDGKPAKISDSPWHVAIYKISHNHLLICGGTLISANMVVSAAHCFFDEAEGKPLPYSDYVVVVSKNTNNYTINDNAYQKTYQIHELIFTDRPYNPKETDSYASDIIVIVLEQTVEISKFVLPACVDWSATQGFNPGEGTPGKLVGWGYDEDVNKGSDNLLYAELPYISFEKCIKKVKKVTQDKFCAGNDSGTGARKGDSGGGLMFVHPDNGRYYLRGVVSTANLGDFVSIATFTDISHHLDWLEKVRKKVQSYVIQSYTTLASKGSR